MFKFLILFFIYIGSALADPSLTISANKSNMAVNETSTVTFIFSQTVAGFDATDINAVGGTISAFSGSGTTYTATFTKTDTNESVIRVDNNSYAPNGTGNFLGFNVSKLYFMNSGVLFSSAKVLAVPQPRCPLTGEQLVNPALPVKEQFFTLERTAYGNSLYYKEAKDTCLVRLQTGQSWQPKASPSVVELANLHGVHNHSGLFPKVSTQQFVPIDGTDKIRVRAYNHDAGLTVTSVGTSVSSNSMLIGSHTYTTNVALGLGVDVAVQIANTTNQAQYVRGRVVSNTGTTLVVNVTQSNGVATLTNWTISTILRVSGHITLDGASRFNFSNCSMGFFDPIVKPGQKGASHHHTFYGNCGINENTTTATIHNSRSSASGGIANQTGYWAPSMIDTATGVAQVPSGIQAYYKVASGIGTFGLTEKLPQGLKIIAGNHLTTTGQGTAVVSYNCYGFPGSANPVGDNLATCPVGTTGFQMVVRFPSCIKDDGNGGMVLDSPDHNSHLAYFGTAFYTNGCPSGFPHSIASISILISYEVKRGQNLSTWRLSSDNYSLNLPSGYSAHADWFMGWRDEWAQRVLDQCNNSRIDCGEQFVGLNNGIGAGTTSGVTISSVTVAGNIATITTSTPHKLPIDLNTTQGGLFAYGINTNVNNGYLLAKITGITGTDASAYNFDPLDAFAYNSDGGPYTNITSVGVQSLKVIDATHLQYTLNYIPTNTTPTIAGMKIQWGESLCTLSDICSSDYYNLYYPVP